MMDVIRNKNQKDHIAMKAFIADKYGKMEELREGEVSVPSLGDKDVLVEVHATSVNVLDIKLRNGEFKLILPYRTPFVLGHDVAGVVVKVGVGVIQFKPGDEVYARLDDFSIGGFAEFAAVKESSVALKPKNITMEEAASIPLVGLTAWQALIERAKLKNGQKVFIQAGSGGVGTFAIQLAKHLGAKVATTTSTANVEWVKALGADVVVDYKQADFATVLNGYDLVLNSQDTQTLKKSVDILKNGSQVISISGPPDVAFAKAIKAPWLVIQIMRLLSAAIQRKAAKRNIGYSFLFMQPSGTQLGQITKLIEMGVIRPVVDKVFPFTQTNEALRYVANGRAKGKVVIKIK
jgi:NADPH:quinone reductase-like Zn-dependent oxidoreductase